MFSRGNEESTAAECLLPYGRSRRSTLLDSVTGTVFSVVLLTFVALFGCSGGGDDEEASVGGSPEAQAKADDKREDAERARQLAEEAEAQKYALEAYKEALNDFNRAKEAYERPNYKTAAKSYGRAVTGFENAKNTAKNTRKSYDAAVEFQKECDLLRAEAEKLGVKEKNAEAWQRAEDLYKEGKEFLVTSGKLTKSKEKFNFAKYEYQAIVDAAKGIVKNEASAKAALGTMETQKEEARVAAAEEHAKPTWELAIAAEEDARKCLVSGDFVKAAYAFDSAREMFKMAEDTAKVAVTIAAATPAKTSDEPDERRAAPPLSPAEVAARKEKQQADSGHVELSDVLRKFYHVDPHYDAAHGTVTLDYSSGVDLKKDAIVPARVKQGKLGHLVFDGEPPPAEEGEEQEDSGLYYGYSFHANTEGIFVLKGRYRDGVRIEFDLRTLLVGSNERSRFEVLFNYEPGTDDLGSGYGVNWGTRFTVYENRRVPRTMLTPVNPAYHRHPKDWYIKRDLTHWVISYGRSADGDDGNILVQFDNGTPGQFVDTFKISNNKRRDGQIAFRWDDMKVHVKNLKIIAKIDEEWAKELVAKSAAEEAEGEAEKDSPFGFIKEK